MIDIELRCGWRVVGTTERARGVQVHDADGNVVQGIGKVAIEITPTDLPRVSVELLPRLSSESMDAPPDSLYSAIAEGRVGSATPPATPGAAARRPAARPDPGGAADPDANRLAPDVSAWERIAGI